MIGETVTSFVGEDEMIQEGDAEQLSTLPESAGEHTIFLARCGITGWVIVGDRKSVV